jgi:glycosyltransferase involved in cell wall biosynthesis
MATYNGALYVKEQIDSILPQLTDDDELLVADDQSVDDTLDILLSYGSKLTVVATTKVGGVVANFERAMSAARGDIVVLSDQDDVWLPRRLDLIRSEIIDCDLLLLNGSLVDGDLHPLDRTIFEAVGVRHGLLANLTKNSFVGCCMAFRRDLAIRAIPFPAGIPWHDWLIGLMAELHGRVKRLDQTTILYRRHGANHSATSEKSSYSFAKRLWMRIVMLRALVAVMLRRA